MPRIDGRAPLDLRPAVLERGYLKFADGSCLITLGDTRVLCAASVEERVPPFLKNTGQGWVTGEYAMLPRSGKQRSPRDSAGKPASRSIEIQRLVGRSLRAVFDTALLGERTITLDCDVIQADGGTRCAAITGAYVALAEAIAGLRKAGLLKRSPLAGPVAAVSVGLVAGEELLDLCYEEDSRAAVDMNVVMTSGNKLIEIQGTAEGQPFDRARLNRLLDAAQIGIDRLLVLQREVLADLG
jgi:ribonuclease PH